MPVKSSPYSLVTCCSLNSAKLLKLFSVITREQVVQIHNTLFQPDLQGRSQQDLQSQQLCACPAWVALPGCYGPWRSDDDAQDFYEKLRPILANSYILFTFHRTWHCFSHVHHP